MVTTHEVFNQPAPLVDVNLFAGNRPMQAALNRLLAQIQELVSLDWVPPQLIERPQQPGFGEVRAEGVAGGTGQVVGWIGLRRGLRVVDGWRVGSAGRHAGSGGSSSASSRAIWSRRRASPRMPP